MRIWKYTLKFADTQSVLMPEGAKPLSVQVQGEAPQLWALVDEKKPLAARTFATYGTGHPLPNDAPGSYVGTYQMHDGALVFHVFEKA